MNRHLRIYLLTFFVFSISYTVAQDQLKSDTIQSASSVFLSDEPLPIKLSFDIKEFKKNTNDSTYFNTVLSYTLKDWPEKNINVKIRKRGNSRLKKCYFPPVTIKFKKEDTWNTSLEGHKKLKLVMPCLQQKDKNDNVIKEYLAYKLYEIISLYHFKTRLVDMTFNEIKGDKIKTHDLIGILIEDDKAVAKRFSGELYKRYSHPLNHDPVTSVKNAFFQYMIGKTDFSQAYQHNMKIIFVDNNIIPIPYDFDMSGLVNCNYAVVSQIQAENLGLTSVKQRKYRGFVREIGVFNQVRQEFLDRQEDMLSMLDNNGKHFSNLKEFEVARNYVLTFFEIMMNDEKFNKVIIEGARNE